MDARAGELEHVRIIEVGPRRGLQSQMRTLDPIVRMNLVELLEVAGVREVEVGAFISRRWLPQLADTSTVFELLGGSAANRTRSAMVANLKGLEMAVTAGCRDITVASAASEAYCRASLNCSIAESLRRADEIAGYALGLGIQVRATLSTIIDCPFGGAVARADVVKLTQHFHDMGCRGISLIDTTGTGTPASVGTLLRACATEVPVHALACHFHDTFGLGIANVIEALENGVRAFDAAISGLGGSTHFPGAACRWRWCSSSCSPISVARPTSIRPATAFRRVTSACCSGQPASRYCWARWVAQSWSPASASRYWRWRE